MGTRYAVVKSVASTDIAALKINVSDNSGTFKKYDTVGLDFDAEFPTDADGAQFATDISGSYTDIDWDNHEALRIQKKVN